MKRDIKIVGIRPYEVTYNDRTFVGTKYYYIFKEDNTNGNACDSFKIPYNKYSDFPIIDIGSEWKIYLERSQNGVRLDDMVPLE